MYSTKLLAFTSLLVIVIASPLDLVDRAATASVTRTTSSSCSLAAVTPLPTSLVCNEQGTIVKVGNTVFAQSSGSAAHVCLSVCEELKGCLSFSFNAGEDLCSYHNATITPSNFLVKSNEVYFYNNACFHESCKTTTITSTIAPTTTTATTSSTRKTTTTTMSTTPVSTCTAPSSDNSKCITISSSIANSVDLITYTEYFSGTALTENPANPGNTGTLLPASTLLLSKSLDVCDAAQQCAAHATLLGLLKIDYSFDLHFVKTSCEWECVLYEGANTDGTYFDVKNASVGAVVGYSGVTALNL